MQAVAASSTAMQAVAANAAACTAIATQIQSYRSTLITALSNTTYFTKSTKTLGNGAGTWTDGLNAANFYIPKKCNDDNDTEYKVYFQNTSQVIATIAKHDGDKTISQGVSIRGVKVVGTGSSNGNVTFDVYTSK